jgi:hypothetical protein
MTMYDMKLTHDQTNADMLGLSQPTENNGPAYPYGLTITLDNDTLKKLAMGLPQVGDKFTLHAMVEAIAVSKDPSTIEDGKRVELQITAMELEPPEDERNEQQKAYDQISKMYA